MSRRIPRALALSVLTLMLVGSGAARAERSPRDCCRRYDPTGFYLSAGHAVSVVPQRWERGFLQDGTGVRLAGGARLSRHFALELNWQRTYHGAGVDAVRPFAVKPTMNTVAVDLRLYPSGKGPAQFYLVGGLGAYTVIDHEGVRRTGPGFQVGAGIDFWLTSWLRLGFQAQYRRLNLQDGQRTSPALPPERREVAVSDAQDRPGRIRLGTMVALVEFAVRL